MALRTPLQFLGTPFGLEGVTIPAKGIPSSQIIYFLAEKIHRQTKKLNLAGQK
jgi:hypothetical protein